MKINLKNPEMKATRDGYGAGILEAAKKDSRIVVLCADLEESLRLLDFKKKFPSRFFEVGVAEQNMMAVAAGLALQGKIPFASSFAVFVPMRTLDQIRISVAYNQANVKFCGGHSGISVGPDGATHQALEDIGALRSIPGITIVVPCDAEEARKATLAAAKFDGPVYLRLTRDKSPIVTSKESAFKIGQAEVLQKGQDVTIIACGTMVYEALLAAQELSKLKISASVINCHTVKPIDHQTTLADVRKTGAVVTAEDHQIFGGLGSAVAEVLTINLPVPQEFVGVQDRFGESGDAKDLAKKYHLTHQDIISAVKKVIGRKK